MWAYVVRKLLFNIPVYLGIILIVMAALRVHDPVWAYLGKNATQQEYEDYRAQVGLDRPFLEQYAVFLWDSARLDFNARSWQYDHMEVGDMLRAAVVPSLALTVPALILTSLISIGLGLISSFNRGRPLDRTLVIGAVLGMCVSFLVYIIVGQYFGAYQLKEWVGEQVFAIDFQVSDSADRANLSQWPHFYLLPVMISVIVAMGYDTRFYRAVMVEECTRDYIVTAQAKGASKSKILFVHMLKNAMIPIITRIMITLPFLVTGSILLEMYFGIPGMGKVLITAISGKDFPVIQVFTAIFTALFIATNILTDVLYALVDPRIRLS